MESHFLKSLYKGTHGQNNMKLELLSSMHYKISDSDERDNMNMSLNELCC